ncbi:MAG: TRIC cation channel family protein [Actinomycetes bacterium]
MSQVPVQTPIWLDMSAVVVAALGGSIVAVRARFDITGVIALGLISGLGGGLLRDVLLNQLPVALKSPWYIIAAFAAASVVAVTATQVQRFVALFILLDAAALGLYGITGANKALSNGLGVAPALLVGMIAAIGGGALRDVATAQPPSIFKRGGQLYATAALAGLIAYAIAWDAGLPTTESLIGSAAIIFVLRVAAWRRNWVLPGPIDAPSRLRVKRDTDEPVNRG